MNSNIVYYKRENISMFKNVLYFLNNNKNTAFFGVSSVLVFVTFMNYNNNFNTNKELILKHVDYVYEKTEENLKYTKTLIEAEKTFFSRMCGYYETISNQDCIKSSYFKDNN